MRPRSLLTAAAVLALLAAPATSADAAPASARHLYNVTEAPGSPACDANFCVHWVATGIDAPPPKDTDGDGVPDAVERTMAVAEHVHRIENGVLGWREPLGDGARGGGRDKTDVYLTELAGAEFGYTVPDERPDRPGTTPLHLSGYLVLDNDYSAFEFPGTRPGPDLKVTLAHEYDHLLQFAYDAREDSWFEESTAVWMEDQVYNGLNGYLRYVRRWARQPRTPLAADTLKEYGSAVWNEWLARHYGPGIIRAAWAGAARTDPDGFAVAAYERAIRAAGPSSFGRDFTRFAADVAEWRTGSGFRESYLYPDLPRQGTLRLGGRRTRGLDHTTFSLLGVHPGAGRAIEVRVEAPQGIAAGLALVGRIGSARHGRTVKSIAYDQGGGGLTAALPDPHRFSRITAVIVDADTRRAGFDRLHRRWRYAGEETLFRLAARTVG